jgi:hypothetical protein
MKRFFSAYGCSHYMMLKTNYFFLYHNS